MKKWLWVVLLVLAIATVLGSGSELWRRPSPVTQLENSKDQPEEQLKVAVAPEKIWIPEVNSKRLFAHIKALNFRRYTEDERDRTRTYLTKSLKKLGWLPTLQPFEGGVNVFAERRGTDSKAGAILVAAHYDTVPASPGADDNATGVAVVMEVARLLGHPTPRTLQLAFFDCEEEGLQGSLAFAANNAHLADLRGVIVMDMVGFACYTPGCQQYPVNLPVSPPTDRGDFLAVVGDAEHLPLLNVFHNSSQPIPPVLTLPVPLKGLLTPDVLRSDHSPFWYKGVGAVLLTDTANLRTPHYHQPSDIPANIDRSFFTGVAQLVVNATTALLESRDRLETEVISTPAEHLSLGQQGSRGVGEQGSRGEGFTVIALLQQNDNESTGFDITSPPARASVH